MSNNEFQKPGDDVVVGLVVDAKALPAQAASEGARMLFGAKSQDVDLPAGKVISPTVFAGAEFWGDPEYSDL